MSKGFSIITASSLIKDNIILNNGPIGCGGGGIQINGSPTVTGNTIIGPANSTYIPYSPGIQINGSPLISANNIIGFGYGISCEGTSSIPIIHDNLIKNNSNYGIFNNDYYKPCPTIDATDNDWGDPSGPLDDFDDRRSGGLYNPDGKGNKVSDHVNYYPWTGTTIGLTATPSGLMGLPGNSSVNLKWDTNTEPFLDGYKIHYGTSSGNYGAPSIIDNVTSYTLTGLTNGVNYFIAVSSMNSVGSESEKSPEIDVTPILDITPPETTLISKPAISSNDSSACFIFSSNETGVTYQCQLDNQGYAPCSSPVCYQGLAEGNHSFSLKATDAAGNVTPIPATYVWAVDTTPPDVLITNKPSNPSNSTTASFSFTATEIGATFQCLLDSGYYWPCPSPMNYSGLSEGNHSLSVRATDAAGNTNPMAAGYAWTIDITAPAVLAFNIPTTSNTLTIPIGISASDNVTITGFMVTESAIAPAPDNPNWSGIAPASYSFTSAGVKTLYAWAKDATGNVSVVSADSIRQVTIQIRNLVSITISTLPQGQTTLQAGQLLPFTSAGKYDDNSSDDISQTVAWNSSDTNVATIQSGYLFGLKAGTVQITATQDNKTSNSIEITITPTPMPRGQIRDDFSKATIDTTKWRQGESVREIRSIAGDDKLYFKTVSPNPVLMTSFPYNWLIDLPFSNPNSINSI